MSLTEQKRKSPKVFLIIVVGNAVFSQTRIIPRVRAGKKHNNSLKTQGATLQLCDLRDLPRIVVLH